MVEIISKKIPYIVPFQLFERTQKCIQKYWLEWSFFPNAVHNSLTPSKPVGLF